MDGIDAAEDWLDTVGAYTATGGAVIRSFDTRSLQAEREDDR